MTALRARWGVAVQLVLVVIALAAAAFFTFITPSGVSQVKLFTPNTLGDQPADSVQTGLDQQDHRQDRRSGGGVPHQHQCGQHDGEAERDQPLAPSGMRLAQASPPVAVDPSIPRRASARV